MHKWKRKNITLYKTVPFSPQKSTSPGKNTMKTKLKNKGDYEPILDGVIGAILNNLEKEAR